MKKIILSGALILAAFSINSFANFSPTMTKTNNAISNIVKKVDQAGINLSSKAKNVQGLLANSQQTINQVQQKIPSTLPTQINGKSSEEVIKAKEALIKKLQTEVEQEKKAINKEREQQAKKERVKAILQKYS